MDLFKDWLIQEPKETTAIEQELLKVVFEAILDGGMSPVSIRGTKMGVFVATNLGKTLPAKKISSAIGLNGPAVTINTAYSNSLCAVRLAVDALRRGECNSALIIEYIHPTVTNQAQDKLRTLNHKKTYVLFLQLSKLAKRSYAVVEYVKSGRSVAEVNKTVYDGLGIDPATVYCIEVNGFKGYKASEDNMGIETGCSAVIRAITGFQNASSPANISAATTSQSSRTMISENGAGGVTYVLLRGNFSTAKASDNLPRLILWSDRTKESCLKVLDEVTKGPLNNHFITLLTNTQIQTDPENIYRGFGIYESHTNAVCIQKEVRPLGRKKPLVWAFGGGSGQWTEMGVGLLKIPMFKATIDKLQRTLEPKGVNIIEILVSKDPAVLKNIINIFVGVVAIQIAFVDILRELNIEPDFITGVSAGEITAAYVDGCSTAEEAILTAYVIGSAASEAKIKASYAIAGLGHQEVAQMLPPGVEIGSHSGPAGTAVTGPDEFAAPFLTKLKTKGILTTYLPLENIGFHSSYMSETRETMLNNLKMVLKHPKRRSRKWLSTSCEAKSEWDDPEGYYSAEYITNNMNSVMLFEEAIEKVPTQSIFLDIGTDLQLTPFIKGLRPGSECFGFISRKLPATSCNLLLEGLGK